MAINAVGSPLLLQSNDKLLKELLEGLKLGDTLKARVVEVLGQDKAVVNVKGQNITAQLPAQNDIQKGDILGLLVTQSQAPDAQGIPTVSLKLLPPQLPVSPNDPQSASTLLTPLQQAPEMPQAALEAALTAAQLPKNSLTFSVVRTLAALGASLNPPSIIQAVQNTEALLNVEQALLPEAQNAQPLVPLPAPVLKAVQNALSQVRLLPSGSQNGEAGLAVQQAGRILESFLSASQETIQPQQFSSLGAQVVASSDFKLDSEIQVFQKALQTFVQTPDLQNLEGLKQALVVATPQNPQRTAELEMGKVLLASLPRVEGATPAVSSPALPAAPQAQTSVTPVAASPAAPAAPQAQTNATPAVSSPATPAAPQAQTSVTPVAASPATPAAPQAQTSVTPVAASPAAPAAPQAQTSVTPVAASPATPAAPQAQISATPVVASPATPAAPQAQTNATPVVTSPIQFQVSSVEQKNPVSTTAQVSLKATEPTQVLVQRETLALLAPILEPATYQPQAFAKELKSLALELTQPQSAPSRALVQSVLLQAPVLEPKQVLVQAQKLIAELSALWPVESPSPEGVQNDSPQAQAKTTYQTSSPQNTEPQLARTSTVPLSAESAKSALQELGLPAPRVSLGSLAPETVAEAVAWLQARDLPAQRPLVEAVASWMSQGQDVLPKAQTALEKTALVPEAVLDGPSGLRQSMDQAVAAYHASALRLDDPQLSALLQAWSDKAGLALEFRVAGSSVETAQTALGDAGESATVPALRPAFHRLEQSLRVALRQAELAGDVEAARSVREALTPTQQTVQALGALPLQAQGAPAFDTVHLPMPVWMNGQMSDGRLSVSWRQGRDRDLGDKEPVNVAVSLKTDSLGEVKVLLQVWKGAAQARVVAQDQSASDFLKQESDLLRDGFKERTPFALQSLDFSVASKDSPRIRNVEGAALGLSLSA